MKIYIHLTERTEKLKILFPITCLQYEYFSEFSQIYNRQFDLCLKRFIVCVDLDSVEKYRIYTSYKTLLIVSSDFLANQLRKYRNLLSKVDLYRLMENYAVVLPGFSEYDSLELQFRVIIMGGGIYTGECGSQCKHTTHIVPGRITVTTKQKIEKYSTSSTQVFTRRWIDRFWQSTVSIIDDQRDNNLNNFSARYFFGLKMCLIGLNEESLENIGAGIIDNGGSLVCLNSIEKCDVSIVPDDFLSEETEFIDIVRSMPEKVVTAGWWRECIQQDCVVEFDQYRLFPIDTEAQLPGEENALKNHNGMSLTQCIAKINNSLQRFKMKNESEILKSFHEIKEVDITSVSVGHKKWELSAEKLTGKEKQRLEKTKEIVIHLKDSKIKIFSNFKLLQAELNANDNNTLSIFFQIFEQVANFYESLYEISNIVISKYRPDTCIGIELLPVISKVKIYFRQYNSHLLELRKNVETINKEHPVLASTIRKFFSKYCSDLKFQDFVNLPLKNLMTLRLIFISIIETTSPNHLDLVFLQHIVNRISEITTMLNETENLFILNQQHIKILYYIGYFESSKSDNPFLTVVDCVHFTNDGLEIPKSLFVFKDSLLLCKFAELDLYKKRYDKIVKHFKNIDERNMDDGQLSSWSSFQSLSSASVLSKSPSSVISFMCRTDSCNIPENKKSFNQFNISKFQKLFTGMSRINWNETKKDMYKEKLEILRTDLISVSPSPCNSSVIGQLFFSIQYTDKNSGEDKISSLKLHLVPRIVKNVKEYKKIQTGHFFEWDFDKKIDEDFTWDQFIIEEKQDFCNLLINQFNITISQDDSLLENEGSLNENIFKTPIQIKKTKKSVFSNKKSSPTLSQSSSSSKNSKSRRLTMNFFKKRKSTNALGDTLPNVDPVENLSPSPYNGVQLPTLTESLSPVSDSPMDFLRWKKHKSNKENIL